MTALAYSSSSSSSTCKMIITKNVVTIRCKCGVVIRNHAPFFNNKRCQMSTKPTKENELDKEKVAMNPQASEQLKALTETSSKLAKALRIKYDDTLKMGNIWYQETLQSLTTKANGMSGGEWYSEKVGFWMKRYENFVGLTEVKAAQHKVVETERLFILAQDERREAQMAINDVQGKIKALHAELEKTHRGEDRYLTLVTQEHQILKEERFLTERLHALEKTERIRFSELSNAVRDSHEKERAQAEKTKYWSVIGSVVGTCLGILGTTINNRMRMKELRQIVKDASMASAGAAFVTTAASTSSSVASSTVDVDKTIEKLKELIEKQQKDLLGVSEKLVSANSEMKAKVAEINQISASLSDAAKSVQSAQQDKPSQKPVGLTIKDLISCFDSQQKVLEKHFNDLRLVLMGNAASATERLSLETIKRSEESEKRLIEALNRTNVASYKAFHTRACDIDEKVKDIRSLILAQAMSSVSPVVSSPNASTQAQLDNLDRSHRTIIGTVETALQEHEERIRSSVVLAGILTAVMTPIVLFMLDKFS